MKLSSRPACVLATLALCLPVAAFGATIYDNGGPSDLNVPSDLDDLGNVPDVELPLILADDFSLSQDFVLQDVHWWGSYLLDVPIGLPEDDFRLELFADASGSPELDPFFSLDLGDIGRTDTGDTDALGNAIFAYDVVFDEGVALEADTTYHLSIVNNTEASLATWAWSASEQLDNLGYHLRNGDLLSWTYTTVPPNLAFELTGEFTGGGEPPIPEPASIGLLGLGLAALVTRQATKYKNRQF